MVKLMLVFHIFIYFANIKNTCTLNETLVSVQSVEFKKELKNFEAEVLDHLLKTEGGDRGLA